MAEISKKKKAEDDDKELNELAQTSLEEANIIQMDLELLSKRMMNKILTVVQEFTVHKEPLYNKRHIALRKISHFWAIAFMNHPKLKLLVNNSVEDCFNYLNHIQVVENEDIKSGYQIVFAFDVNPYFYNCELIKHNVYDSCIISSLKTNIDWKDNMNISSDRRSKGKKRGPPIENFFDWLQRCSNNKTDIICDIIKDDLWTDPLKYFFLPDDAGDENSESESDEDFDYFMDSNEDDSHDDENADNDENGKQGLDSVS